VTLAFLLAMHFEWMHCPSTLFAGSMTLDFYESINSINIVVEITWLRHSRLV